MKKKNKFKYQMKKKIQFCNYLTMEILLVFLLQSKKSKKRKSQDFKSEKWRNQNEIDL